MTEFTARKFNPTMATADQPGLPQALIAKHPNNARRMQTYIGIAGMGAILVASACSSTSTTVSQGNPDAGSHVGGSGNGGATGTSPNCLKLGVTGCTNSCCNSGTVCVSDKCVINATLADGASCTGPAECKAKTCLAGVCGPPPCRNATESCDSDFPCCSQLFCDGAGKCRALKQAGEICSATLPCDSGLYCNSAKTCQALGVNGQSCSSTEPCGSGLTCTSGACAACAPLTCLIALRPIFLACLATSDVGATCASPTDCCSANCDYPTLKCVKACQALGALCSVASDCCSGECLNNECVYSSCKATGVGCNADTNCCSNHCGTDAKCQ